jgi:hypothetical protein
LGTLPDIVASARDERQLEFAAIPATLSGDEDGIAYLGRVPAIIRGSERALCPAPIIVSVIVRLQVRVGCERFVQNMGQRLCGTREATLSMSPLPTVAVASSPTFVWFTWKIQSTRHRYGAPLRGY